MGTLSEDWELGSGMFDQDQDPQVLQQNQPAEDPTPKITASALTSSQCQLWESCFYSMEPIPEQQRRWGSQSQAFSPY